MVVRWCVCWWVPVVWVRVRYHYWDALYPPLYHYWDALYPPLCHCTDTGTPTVTLYRHRDTHCTGHCTTAPATVLLYYCTGHCTTVPVTVLVPVEVNPSQWLLVPVEVNPSQWWFLGPKWWLPLGGSHGQRISDRNASHLVLQKKRRFIQF